MGFVVVFFTLSSYGGCFLSWILCSSLLSSNKNSNCFYSYFQGFKERNNIIDDYIF